MEVVQCCNLELNKCTTAYCVGVLQAAIIPLIQDVEASALIICTVGSTGNLKRSKVAPHNQYYS